MNLGANALVRFNPTDEAFEVFTLPSSEANVIIHSQTGTIIDLAIERL
ncbi:MAG: hypothetical protein WBL67_14815 [Nitrososphaeraceae archaeon]